MFYKQLNNLNIYKELMLYVSVQLKKIDNWEDSFVIRVYYTYKVVLVYFILYCNWIKLALGDPFTYKYQVNRKPDRCILCDIRRLKQTK